MSSEIVCGEWAGCYADSWGDWLVPEAFAHPAKFAPGLITRIYAHGFEREYWRAGDLVADPFGGIAGGGIIAASLGLRWIGVELEPRFCALAQQNIELHRRTWEAMGDPIPILIQSDSRHFGEIITGDWCKCEGEKGQIGQLPPGDLAAVVTSPPYADSVNSNHAAGIDWSKADRPDRVGRTTQAGVQGDKVVTYGSAEGQIGALKSGAVDAVVTSPPYEEGLGHDSGHPRLDAKEDTRRETEGCARRKGYGAARGNVGNDAGGTYWEAMSLVYQQCFLALKPGGVLACVVKDYVKNRKRVPLCDDTLKLLVHVGFEPLERVRAMLTETTTKETLYGPLTTVKKRASFFRRLAEKKGSPPIDWEEVLWVQKPA